MNLGLLANLGDVFDKAVPTLVLADHIHPMVGLVFSVIICCGIYTTTVPMLWGVVRHFAQDGSRKFVLVALILSALGLANMWLAIGADVGVMILAVLNAIRCLFVKNI